MPSSTTQISGVGSPGQFQYVASAARTASADFTYVANEGRYSGIRVFIETTAASSPSTTFSIQVKDTKNAQYHTLLTTAAVTGTGRALMEVYPAGAAVANVRATYHLGRGFRVISTHGNANSHTYNIVAEWLN